jgi:hypothetical protein
MAPKRSLSAEQRDRTRAFGGMAQHCAAASQETRVFEGVCVGTRSSRVFNDVLCR